MLRLLGRKTSGNVQKVLWLLEELGVDYIREDYGRQFGNTGDAAYLQMNPTGKVPTLIDGEYIIWESNTILRYLCLKQNSDLIPGDLASRAKCETWMDWLLASLNSHYLNVFKESKKAEEDRTEIDVMGSALIDQLSILDKHLERNKWIGGDFFSMADIALGPICNRCLGFPINLPELASTRRWHDLISERTAYQKVVAA
ncbi:MAG: glutathione S-transferase [Acidiferrobacteraceae bacterium]|nr:glutathione S-transferase [Acidiferrobacteraceae bacterium]